MRIYLRLSRSETIPFNYQQYLTGAIHKWLGSDNSQHGETALFSFSWLQHADSVKGGLKTNADSYFFISAHEEAFIKDIITGIRKDNQVCFGAEVTEVQLAETPSFESVARFSYASPVFVKRRVEERVHHFEHSDPQAAPCLTETLQHKLAKAGLASDGVSVRFDEQFNSPRTKIISYGTIRNRVNLCPVIVEGTPEQIGFAWNVGVGNSTGIGFGALK